MNMQWREIKDYPLYEISNYGHVRRKETKKLIKPRYDKDGYHRINLYYNKKKFKVWHNHKLVLITFTGKYPKFPYRVCRHLDGNKLNNKLTNLTYGTLQENKKDEFRHGTIKIGSDNPTAILNESEVIEIRQLYRQGMTLNEIKAKYNYKSRGQLSNVITGRSWKHVPLAVKGDEAIKLNRERDFLRLRTLKNQT